MAESSREILDAKLKALVGGAQGAAAGA